MVQKDLKFVIADDHPLFLRGLADFLHQLGYDKITQSFNGADALQKIVDQNPHFAILDIQMPYLSGIEIAQKAASSCPDTRFIILSYHKDPYIFHMSRELNISAYILKEDALQELENCIQELLSEKSYFSKNVLSFSDSKLPPGNPSDRLTPAEKKVLKFIARDLTSKEIARDFGISVRTVEKHRSNIIEKLSLKGDPDSLRKWAKRNMNIL